MTRTQRNEPIVSGDAVPSKTSSRRIDCHITDHSSPAEIDECIERTRRELNSTLQVLEHRLTTQKLFDDAKIYMQQNYKKQMDWFSNLPQRVNSNPTPFAIIGAGMLLGGAGIAGYALSKQRKNAGKPAAYKRLAEKGKQTWQRRSGDKRIPRPMYSSEPTDRISSTNPETFHGEQEYQASTEEILRDQAERKKQDERRKSPRL
jgi:hypothetical protein